MNFIKMTGKTLLGFGFVFGCILLFAYSLISGDAIASAIIQWANSASQNPFSLFILLISIPYALYIASYFYDRDNEVYGILSLIKFTSLVVISATLNNLTYKIIMQAEYFSTYSEDSLIFSSGLGFVLLLLIAAYAIQMYTIFRVILTRNSWFSINKYMTYI